MKHKKRQVEPPYNFTDRVHPRAKPDRNGWYFRPEPRSFFVAVSSDDGIWNVTQANDTGYFTLWFYDLPLAGGSRDMIIDLFYQRSGYPKINTKGD